jgi:uncharacterized protein YndB with AHSA1/START domain
MLKKILGGVLVIVAAILIFAATRPDNFRVERAATINAPPEKIFALLNDFHQWSAWSPWEKLDSNMTRAFSGPMLGVGSVYEWSGNKDVGMGRMEIASEAAPMRLLINLDFLEPFESHNTAEFTLESRGESTNVVWSIQGPSNYVMKVMTVFTSMDAMMGKDFEAGLANLKALAER